MNLMLNLFLGSYIIEESSEEIPDNVVLLDGEPVKLDGEYVTLD